MGGVQGGGPEKDPEVHAPFEAAGYDTEGEQAFIWVSRVRTGLIAEMGR